MCACKCVCVCVRVCECACVCVCVRADVREQISFIVDLRAGSVVYKL